MQRGWCEPVWATLACVLLSFAAAPLFAAEGKADPRVYDAGAKVGGKTRGEWGVAWCRWALGIKRDRNPCHDKTGEFAAEGQAGPVWFLAGNLGGKTTRRCAVPSDKPLFLPVLTDVEAGDPDKADQKAMAATAKKAMDSATDLEVLLDGKPVKGLEKFRAQTGVFDFTGPEKASDALFAEASGKRKGYADGYWIMLKPLSPGKHTLRFKGKCKEERETFELDVTYELTAEEKK
jgi:hypothetical protein